MLILECLVRETEEEVTLMLNKDLEKHKRDL